MPEGDGDSASHSYVALSVSVAVLLAFFVITCVWICFRSKSGKRVAPPAAGGSVRRATPDKRRRNRLCPEARAANFFSKQVVDSPHNYEEIPGRPAVPPRVTAASQADRKQVAAVRFSQRAVHLSVQSPPTYDSEQYMQIVCDADGNCQYIPRDEIPDKGLPPVSGRHHSVTGAVVGRLAPLPEESGLPPYPRAVRPVSSAPEGGGRLIRSQSLSDVKPAT